MMHDWGSIANAASSLPRPDAQSRIRRSVYLARSRLDWDLHLHQRGGRRQHLFDTEAVQSPPGRADCSSAPHVTFAGSTERLAHDAWTGWGAGAAPQTVQVYTDGSYSAVMANSAWSVAVGDAWLLGHFQGLPTDERLLRAHHLVGATLAGANIVCTQGIYPAELQAIARVLAMFPLSFNLDIHSDSRAAIDAISSYVQQLNERKRLRMSARPLLQLIHNLLARRVAAGGRADMQHVAAHSKGSDLHSVGNRLADYQANLSRGHADRSAPLTLRELPLESCERHFHIRRQARELVIDDIRRSALSQLRESMLIKWASKPDQVLACSGMIELGRIALRFGTPAHQSTLIHVATNSVHFHWVADAPPSRESSLQHVQCEPCASTLSLDHLASCPAPLSSDFRRRLRDGIVRVLAQFDDAAGWLRRHSHLDLDQILLLLFPAAPHHFLLCMIGAFSASESTHAAKLLHLTPDDTPRATREIRLLCLESIEKVYTLLKNPP